MKLTTLTILCVLLLALTGCHSSRSALPYFTDLTMMEGELPTLDYQPKIVPDDELYILVSSSNPEATAMYNMPIYNPATRQAIDLTMNTRPTTYVVDSKGDISMPLLGEIHVAGLTTEQVAQKLTEIIQQDVVDPIVMVRLMNFSVSVAGEVTKPGVVNLENERMSILDALAAVGDLTPYGNRKDVLIIREEDGKRTYAHLDLTDSNLLTSPYYYVRQNDYIYVTPNKIREDNAKYNQNNAFKLSVISTIVSATSVVASLIIALAVK
ncbi:MAG: polysaccharide biosynthesis/export family protein [Muribaculaceae bacterium]|nr:polysaccharide biosynthesis/export family protein [Muribaculaceae bacterium]